MNLITYSASDKIIGPTSDGFTITEIPQAPMVSDVTTVFSKHDGNVFSTALTTRLYPSLVTATDGRGAACTVISADPTKVTVNAAGLAVPLSTSDTKIIVVSPNTLKYGSKAINKSWNVTSGLATEVVEFKQGSLANYLVNTFNGMLSGLTPSTTTYNTYTSNGYIGGAVTKNPNLFCKDYDFSGMAIASQAHSGTSYNPPCLISARHAVSCIHWLGVGGGAGTLVYFQGVLGTVYTRTRTGSRQILNTDIAILSFDSDLPIYSPSNPLVDGVTPFQLLPANVANWLADLGGYTATRTPPVYEYPLLTKYANYGDRFGVQWVNNFGNYLQQGNSNGQYFSYRYNQSFLRYTAWSPYNAGTYSSVYPGDSGSPDFFPINGKLVILGTHNLTTGSVLMNKYLTEIQAAMNAEVPGYSPSIVDLSSFTQYTSP